MGARINRDPGTPYSSQCALQHASMLSALPLHLPGCNLSGKKKASPRSNLCKIIYWEAPKSLLFQILPLWQGTATCGNSHSPIQACRPRSTPCTRCPRWRSGSSVSSRRKWEALARRNAEHSALIATRQRETAAEWAAVATAEEAIKSSTLNLARVFSELESSALSLKVAWRDHEIATRELEDCEQRDHAEKANFVDRVLTTNAAVAQLEEKLCAQVSVPQSDLSRTCNTSRVRVTHWPQL